MEIQCKEGSHRAQYVPLLPALERRHGNAMPSRRTLSLVCSSPTSIGEEASNCEAVDKIKFLHSRNVWVSTRNRTGHIFIVSGCEWRLESEGRYSQIIDVRMKMYPDVSLYSGPCHGRHERIGVEVRFRVPYIYIYTNTPPHNLQHSGLLSTHATKQWATDSLWHCCVSGHKSIQP